MSRRRTTTGSIRRKKNRRVTQKAPPRLSLTGSWAGTAVRVALAGLLVTGTVLLAAYGWQSLSESRRLRVTSVEVLGSERARWDELQAYTQLHVNDPILEIDLDNVAAGVRRHPWVKSATVRRRLPNRVTIQVQEHEPGILVALEEIYLANREGVLFKRLSPLDHVVLPVLTGMTKEDPIMRPEATQGVIQEAMALAAVCASADVAPKLGTLEELHWDWALGWSIIVRSSAQPTIIHLGLDPVPRVDVALAALQQLKQLGRVPAEVWADAKQRTHRVQVRLASQGAAHSDTTDQPTLFAKAGD